TVDETGDAASTVRTGNAVRPDVLFLDIRMPEGDGLEVLHQLDQDPHVIFTTAFDRYAVAAFEVQALDYLLKPFGAKRLGQALDRVRQQLGARHAATVGERLAAATGRSQPLRRLYVRVGGRIIPVPVEKILHCEARGGTRRPEESRARLVRSQRRARPPPQHEVLPAPGRVAQAGDVARGVHGMGIAAAGQTPEILRASVLPHEGVLRPAIGEEAVS